MKTYLAINLDQFHKNAKDGQTTAQIRFIPAINMKKAASFIRRNYPANDWSLVPEGCFNRHIVLKQLASESIS
jgi:hypothetical protein